MPAKTSIPATTHQQLIDAVVERRASRIIYDARNSTSLKEEIGALLRYSPSFAKLPLRELLLEWDDFDPDEDAADYIVPELNLDALRQAAARG